MSDYDLQQSRDRSRHAMDYASSGSGGGLWAAIGLVAVVALIAAIFIGSGGGEGEVTAPATGAGDATAPSAATAPATAPAAGDTN